MEAVRCAFRAWSERDGAAIRALYAPDASADGGALTPEYTAAVHGRDMIVRTFEEQWAAFERSEIVPEAFLEAGETLVVPLLWRGVPKGAESVVEQRLVGSYTFCDGLITSLAWFVHIDEALDALGLPHSAAAGLVPASQVPGAES